MEQNEIDSLKCKYCQRKFKTQQNKKKHEETTCQLKTLSIKSLNTKITKNISTKKPKTILCRYGYFIDKNQWPIPYLEEVIKVKIEKDLIVKPFVKMDYGATIDEYPVYLENKDFYRLPKFYGINAFGNAEHIENLDGEKINIKFVGEPRPNQLEPINDTINALKTQYGGVLCLPCGYGKTMIALYILSILQVKTLIIVHKTFLMDQWIERIHQFLPDAKIGIIQGPSIDVTNKDIVIGMLQSLSMKDYDQHIFDSFGFVIIDEVHHISSEVFSRALPKVSCKYTLGLSATPYREDKLEKVFHWYLGPLILKVENVVNKDVLVRVYKYRCKHELFHEVIRLMYDKKAGEKRPMPMMSTMISNITNIPERNNFISKLINDLKTTDPSRKILILSDRLEHLDTLVNMIMLNSKYSYGYYKGGMKKEELKLSENKELIFGTYPMASEALDIANLDTLILTTPKSKITQSVGRILREKKGNYKNQQLVIDIIDNLNESQITANSKFVVKNNYNKCAFVRQGEKRQSYYKLVEFNIETYDVDIDDNTKIIKVINNDIKNSSSNNTKIITAKQIMNEDLFCDDDD